MALKAQTALAHHPAKADGSPVTDVDLAIETRLRDELRSARPEDAILGEEFGRAGQGDRVWIIDPVDGTAHYIAGREDWGTHVALQASGDVVLGVVTRPARETTWYATRDGGAFVLSSSSATPSRLDMPTSPSAGRPRIAVWEKEGGTLASALSARFSIVPSTLDAILHVAEGRLDGVVDVSGRPWDHAPYARLIEEAGGRFSDRFGQRCIDDGLVCYSRSDIHDGLLELIARYGQSGGT
jgi:histidinol-phosphatase